VTYQVELDIYSGPLDLLLYLIEKEEIDILDIPIARILEKYLEYLEKARELDVNLAAEFLVMASTLMEIKSRMLIPVEERPPEEQEEDPRGALLRQLLVFRAFKEAAMRLGELQELRARRYGRGRPVELPGDEAPEQAEPLKEASLFELADAWARLVRQTLGSGPRTIVYDEISLEERMDVILGALQRRPEFALQALLQGARNRAEIAGTFFALLELVRQRKVRIYQSTHFGEILVTAWPEDADEFPEPPGPPVEPYLPQPEALPSDAEGQRLWRLQRRARFQGIDRPEDRVPEPEEGEEVVDEAEARTNRRIDEILRRADEISARFEALRAGRLRTGGPGEEAAGTAADGLDAAMAAFEGAIQSDEPAQPDSSAPPPEPGPERPSDPGSEGGSSDSPAPGG